MNTKISPSPWKIGKAIQQNSLAVFDANATLGGGLAQTVCMISPMDKITETDFANAALISSSPELLDALLEAKKTIRAMHGELAWEIYEHNSPEMRKINAAIEKATKVFTNQ